MIENYTPTSERSNEWELSLIDWVEQKVIILKIDVTNMVEKCARPPLFIKEKNCQSHDRIYLSKENTYFMMEKQFNVITCKTTQKSVEQKKK